jgi:hypothetical protein
LAIATLETAAYSLLLRIAKKIAKQSASFLPPLQRGQISLAHLASKKVESRPAHHSFISRGDKNKKETLAQAKEPLICYKGSMNVNPNLKRDFGKVVSALGENVPDAEMDTLLKSRQDEIEILLEEARQAKARGEIAPLEPLHDFLRRARERLQRL